jgi:hypothetical protein
MGLTAFQKAVVCYRRAVAIRAGNGWFFKVVPR